MGIDDSEFERIKENLLKKLLKGEKAGEKEEIIDLRGLECNALKQFIIRYQSIEEGRRYRVILDNYACFIMIRRTIALLGGKLIDLGRGDKYLYIVFEKQ